MIKGKTMKLKKPKPYITIMLFMILVIYMRLILFRKLYVYGDAGSDTLDLY